MVAGTDPQSLAGRRVLIVDDSKEITSLLADAFSLAGACSVEVNGGTDAMVFLLAGGFDVVVLDMVMPQPDGWHVLQFMHDRPEWLGRTIILTGNTYDPHVAETVREHGIACLFKPFLLTDLVDAARAIVARTNRVTAA